jgi:hypothetical protein
MRERPRTPNVATVYRGVAEREHLRLALSDLEIQVSDLAARWDASDNFVERDRWVKECARCK